MAVTVTVVHTGPNLYIADVEATADADAGSGVLAHGINTQPLEVTLTPLSAAARLSEWILGVLTATDVSALKTAAVGSGAPGNQVRIIVRRPHSIVR